MSSFLISLRLLHMCCIPHSIEFLLNFPKTMSFFFSTFNPPETDSFRFTWRQQKPKSGPIGKQKKITFCFLFRRSLLPRRHCLFRLSPPSDRPSSAASSVVFSHRNVSSFFPDKKKIYQINSLFWTAGEIKKQLKLNFGSTNLTLVFSKFKLPNQPNQH